MLDGKWTGGAQTLPLAILAALLSALSSPTLNSEDTVKEPANAD